MVLLFGFFLYSAMLLVYTKAAMKLTAVSTCNAVSTYCRSLLCCEFSLYRPLSAERRIDSIRLSKPIPASAISVNVHDISSAIFGIVTEKCWRTAQQL